jgi:hypothetical protein
MKELLMVKCSVCEREFENGYKLGGHKSACHSSKNETIKKNTKSHLKVFIKTCLKCGKEFEVIRREKDGTLLESRDERKYCSRSCANGQKHSIEWKNNIAQGLKGKTSWYIDGRNELKEKCKICGCDIRISNKSGYCRKCICTVPVSEETRKKLSEAQLKLVREGKHHGWPIRTISSYPERFFKWVLQKNGFEEGIDYKFNFTVRKRELGLDNSSCYFLDFFFPNVKLNLEIDGSQHTYYEESVLHDSIRDNLLKNNGYKVYRIPWKNIKTPSGKAYMKIEIDKFFDYLNSLRK